MLKSSEIKFRIDATEARANKVDLHWALCIFESPLNRGVVNYRVGYFETYNELELWVNGQHETYNTKLDFPYMIESDFDSLKFMRGNFKVDYDG